jgi:thiopurine S-methyltransferase
MVQMTSDRVSTRTDSTLANTQFKGFAFQTAALVVAAATSFSYYYLTKGGLKSPATTSSKDRSVGLEEATENDRLGMWQKKWSSGATRWHKTEVHPSLKQYLDEKILQEFPIGGARILVPLCGKTVDMEYMARKRPVAEVVGIDGVRKAIEEFAKEHPDLSVEPVESVAGFEKWKGESISLLTGDFFNVDVETAGGVVDAVWDRGSLVAIQPTLREQYVEKLGELLCKPNGRILLSTYVRPNGDIKTGPPFSIDEAEVRRLFEGKPWVESVEFLDSHSAASLEPWYKAIALYFRLGNMQEHIYLIKTK